MSHHTPAPNYPAPAYDGLTEIWSDSWEDHDAFFTSPNFLDRVKPDEPTFIDFSTVGIMVTDERMVDLRPPSSSQARCLGGSYLDPLRDTSTFGRLLLALG